ncbi:MAG TPA: polysaccharide deacetylase family protein [Phycicoccus sp.]|nr:polysaccharide deacetylase family protein [Phycicoccus sp.]
MERRGFLGVLATAVAAGLNAGCSSGEGAQPTGMPSGSATGNASSPASPSPSPSPSPSATRMFGSPTGITKVPLPKGTIYKLPGEGNLVAITVDDGTDESVVAAYAHLAERTGMRLTFFANGNMPSWTKHAPLLRPLVDQGQALICNHTWSHPDLTKLSAEQVADQVTRNETFLKNTYGTLGRPFLRPPFGYRNARLNAQLADLGYPVVTMWEGSFSDSGVLPPEVILDNAKQWIGPQRLVIGHANHPPVIEVMDQIVQVIKDKGLTPVHLGDVYAVS